MKNLKINIKSGFFNKTLVINGIEHTVQDKNYKFHEVEIGGVYRNEEKFEEELIEDLEELINEVKRRKYERGN